MAKKKVLKAQTRAGRKRATPSARVSTRRLPAAGDNSRRRGARTPALERAIGDTPRETLQVTLDLRDVSGQLIRDPETFFTFRRLSDHRQIGDQLALELTGAPSVFDLPVGTGEIVVCEIDPKRFRFATLAGVLQIARTADHEADQLLREPKEWTPRFTRWNDLPGAFSDLSACWRPRQRSRCSRVSNLSPTCWWRMRMMAFLASRSPWPKPHS